MRTGGRQVSMITAVLAAVLAAASTFAGAPSQAAPRGVTASWSPAGKPKQTVTQTSGVFLKGRVYVPGGWTPGFSTAFDKMQYLSTKTGKWMIDSQSMPVGGMAQGAVCTNGKKVFVVNGISSLGALLNSLQIYDPAQPLRGGAPAPRRSPRRTVS